MKTELDQSKKYSEKTRNTIEAERNRATPPPKGTFPLWIFLTPSGISTMFNFLKTNRAIKQIAKEIKRLNKRGINILYCSIRVNSSTTFLK